MADQGNVRRFRKDERPWFYCSLLNGCSVSRRRDHDIETQTEIGVSPNDDVELRGVRITNGSPTRRIFDVTSYAEIALALPATDAPRYLKSFLARQIATNRKC